MSGSTTRQTKVVDKQVVNERYGSFSPPSYIFRPVRTRLLEELEREAHGRSKVVSILAPAGYGKTVLMSGLYAHLQQTGERCYWIGLDDRHGTLDRVLHALKIGLAGAGTGLESVQALLRGDEPIESRLEEILDQLSRLPIPSTLFIDNLNSCDDETLGVLLDALIFRTRPGIGFVWSGTVDLDIHYERARLEGLIRQVGLSELSLNQSEARELLGPEIESRLGAAGIETILRQTEGWPAAVRLIQIILAESQQPIAALESFSGTDTDLAALLNRQVLEGFAPDLREFLLSIALLRTFSLDLCRQISANDAERHLDELIRRNIFVIPLDRNRHRYRLHGLFREYLLGEARSTLSIERQRDILQRAASGSEAAGEWQDAIDYALAAHDTALASRIMEGTAALFVRDRGDIAQYLNWTERILAAQEVIGWEAHFWYVWALVFQRRYASCRAQLQQLSARLDGSQNLAGNRADDRHQRLNHLVVCIDLLTDQLGGAEAGADRWLQETASNDPYALGSIHSIKNICLVESFRLDAARTNLRIAEPFVLEAGGAHPVGWMYLIRSALYIHEGEYANAESLLAAGLANVRNDLGEDSVLSDTLAFVAALCAVETGRDDEARTLLTAGLRTAHSYGLVGTAAFGFDAAVKLWHGKDDNLISISRLRDIASSYPARLDLMLSCYLIRRLLCLGRLKEALDEAARIGLDLEGDQMTPHHNKEFAKPRYRDLYRATVIDLLIATHRFRQAESLIKEETEIARTDGRAARLVDLELTRMAIEIRTGNLPAASRELISAVRRAARRKILRPFRDHGDILAGLLNNTVVSSWRFSLDEERAFFADVCAGLPVGGTSPHEWSEVLDPGKQCQFVPTRREAELLALMDMGLSNQEIADQGNVSITTIRWHLKNLYRKFGVSSRAAALARARSLDLLPH